jgi:arabinofuranan 3-O-arabinosyltransferase
VEPGARAAQAVSEQESRFGWRLVAACALLTGLALMQSAGLVVADTKLDLAIAPVDFLRRAAHLWDAEGAFGQLQNQAYGYLWPMGPFHALGHLVDLPPWVVQRLWMALVLCVAFVGMAVLARALGVRSDLACIVAGFAFALSPRMLTVLGPSSIEVWPSALAPWVLLPLVLGSRRGSPVRAAALAALAVAMVGGVNAAATSAVLPLGVLWLLTREPGPRRRSMMLWWPTFTVLGTLWWLVPLFLLGAYSPPFLDFIETSAVTTYPTTLADALRGTSNWVAYLDTDSRAGRDLITSLYLPLNSAVVVAAGVAGLALRRNEHRLFLVSGVFAGLLLVTMGHHGDVQGWFASQLGTLLDGSLAPLRNVHKFDVVLRVPLVIGLAFALDELQSRWAGAQRTRTRRLAVSERTNVAFVIGVVVVAVVGSTSPAWAGRITPAKGFDGVPGYWREAAAWLEQEQQDHPGVALLVPGSSFGTYVWGTPRDEPMQPLAGSPWAVRNAVPLTPAGNIRMLDEIERRINEGQGSAGLASYLRRAGVSHVVVRNDLERGPDIADPVLVHQALDDTPGLVRAAGFGPEIGGEARIEGGRLGKALVNSGWQSEYRTVEVYRLSGDVPYATEAADPGTVVVGGPEDLLDLADAGVVGSEPVRLAVDVDESAAPDHVVLTDGLRAVERNFGRLHDSVSPTLSSQEWEDVSRSGVPDYALEDGPRWLTVAELDGAALVTASSTQSDPSSLGLTRRGTLPEAAVDGDERTAWRSAALTSDAHWWRLDLDSPRELGVVTVRAGDAGDEILVVSTPNWESEPLRFAPGESRSVEVPGTTPSVTVTDVSERPGNVLELAEVDVGLDVARRLVLPTTPEAWGTLDAIVLRRLDDRRSGCVRLEDVVRCAAHKAGSPEEARDVHRRFASPTNDLAPAHMLVSPDPGPALDRVILEDQPVFVSATSAGVDDPRARPVAAVDGDTGTTWMASSAALNPELRLSWLGQRTVTGLGMSVNRVVAARLPQRVELSWPGGTRTVTLRRGSAQFDPIRTDQLTIRVLDAEPAADLGFDGSSRDVPIGIGELVLKGVPYLPLDLPDEPVRTRCGTGPTIRNNAVSHRTRVVGSPADMLSGRRLQAVPCRGDMVPLRAGVNDVDLLASDAFVPDVLVLGDLSVAQDGTTLPTQQPDPVLRRVDVAGAGGVATRENASPGWAAEVDGREAAPKIFDGWRQGWTTPAAGDLELSFAPDRAYRAALLSGAVALGGLLAVTWVVRRRRRHAPEVRRRGRLPVLAHAGVLLVIAGLVAGNVGLAVALVGTAYAMALHHRAPEAGAWWLGAPLVATYAAYAVRPWGGAAGWAGQLAWPQLLVVLCLSAVAAWVWLDDERRGRPSRSAGRSTTR